MVFVSRGHWAQNVERAAAAAATLPRRRTARPDRCSTSAHRALREIVSLHKHKIQ